MIKISKANYVNGSVAIIVGIVIDYSNISLGGFMKKIISFIITVSFLFSLVGCNSSQITNSNTSNTKTTEVATSKNTSSITKKTTSTYSSKSSSTSSKKSSYSSNKSNNSSNSSTISAGGSGKCKYKQNGKFVCTKSATEGNFCKEHWDYLYGTYKSFGGKH